MTQTFQDPIQQLLPAPPRLFPLCSLRFRLSEWDSTLSRGKISQRIEFSKKYARSQKHTTNESAEPNDEPFQSVAECDEWLNVGDTLCEPRSFCGVHCTVQLFDHGTVVPCCIKYRYQIPPGPLIRARCTHSRSQSFNCSAVPLDENK